MNERSQQCRVFNGEGYIMICVIILRNKNTPEASNSNSILKGFKMKSITTPFRPSQYLKPLPSIPEDEAVVLETANFRKFARANQALSMRRAFTSNNMVRVKACNDLTRADISSSLINEASVKSRAS